MLKIYSEDICDYLGSTNEIDFDNELIMKVSDELWKTSQNKLSYIQAAFEYVRDEIAHSADVCNDALVHTASEVLREKHGICFTKSYLLAAMLRYKKIPAGFCYQKLILDDETAPILVYHGLNGVYLEDLDKWIRLDARGNKPGVNAQFSINEEHLAFPVRKEYAEEDGLVVYPVPDMSITECLKNSKSRTELWEHLPTDLAYLHEN